MVTGAQVFADQAPADLERSHRSGRRGVLDTGLPLPLRELMAQCLAVDPIDRFATWAELEDVLGKTFAQVAGREVPSPMDVHGGNRQRRFSLGIARSDIASGYLDIGKSETARDCFVRRRDGWSRIESSRLMRFEDWASRFQTWATCAPRLPTTSSRWRSSWSSEIAGVKAECWGCIGDVHTALGDVPRAIDEYNRELQMAHKIGDPVGVANALTSLATRSQWLGCRTRRSSHADPCSPGRLASLRGFEVSRMRAAFAPRESRP